MCLLAGKWYPSCQAGYLLLHLCKYDFFRSHLGILKVFSIGLVYLVTTSIVVKLIRHAVSEHHTSCWVQLTKTPDHAAGGRFLGKFRRRSPR